MKIECDHDPDKLIDQIGDRFFSIQLDEDLSDLEKNQGFGIIIDCEDGVRIEISSDYGKEFNLNAARNLVTLLNQEYSFVPCEQ